MGSIMDSYDATFTGYQRQIGDLTQTNTQIRNDVIAADNRLKSFGVSHMQTTTLYPTKIVLWYHRNLLTLICVSHFVCFTVGPVIGGAEIHHHIT